MGTPFDSENTKAAIIEAAGRLFSVFGFSGVTIRDIIAKAHCNINAVNYHFGSKMNLYRVVMLHACELVSITPSEQQLIMSLAPEESLQALIKVVLSAYNQQKDAKWHLMLISREVQYPSFLYAEVIELYYKPQIAFIANVAARCSSQPQENVQNWFTAFSVISLVEMFGLYRHLITDVSPELIPHLEEDEIGFRIKQFVLHQQNNGFLNY